MILTLMHAESRSITASIVDHNDTAKTFMPVPRQNNYSVHAIGLRAIGTTGITYKHFNPRGSVFEGILGFGNNTFSITGLFEKYINPFSPDHLDLYYGIGGHIIFGSEADFGVDRNRFGNDDDFGLGLDFILGIELLIPRTPLALSLDIKPFFEVTTKGNTYTGLDPGFGLKFFF